MKNINKKFVFMIFILCFIQHIILFSQECKIKKDIFEFSYEYSESDCREFKNTLDIAILQLIERLEENINNPNPECIPVALVDLIKSRFCSSGSEIEIALTCDKCDTEKEKVLVWCDKSLKYVQIWRTKERKGGTFDYTQIRLCKKELEKGPDNIEMFLFHETIHIVENFYGFEKYKKFI